jgi:hypothetical protein
MESICSARFAALPCGIWVSASFLGGLDFIEVRDKGVRLRGDASNLITVLRFHGRVSRVPEHIKLNYGDLCHFRS